MAYGVNAPFGLQPNRHLNGSIFNGQMTEYQIDTTVARNIYSGDPVIVTSNGQIASPNFAGGSITTVAFLGVFMGCKYYDSTRTQQFSPYWGQFSVAANTNPVALIVDQNDVVYDIQVSYSSTGTVPSTTQLGALQTNVFQNAGIAVGGTFSVNPPPNNPASGSTVSGLSGAYLDLANLSNTPTYPLKIIGFVQRPGNVVYSASGNVGIGNGNQGAFNNVLVTINNHLFNGGTGTAGV